MEPASGRLETVSVLLLQALDKALISDSATSICCHSNFVAIGTLYGHIYLADYNGSKILDKWKPHKSKVNCVAITEAGDVIATAGQDERITIQELTGSKKFLEFKFSFPMLSVALSPNFRPESSKHMFAAGGVAGILTLHSHSWWNGPKSDVVDSGEGQIVCIRWRSELVAWANDVHVKIADSKRALVLATVERDLLRPPKGFRADLYPADVQWRDDNTLLAASVRTITVIHIQRLANVHDLRCDVVRLQLSEIICGLVPTEDHTSDVRRRAARGSGSLRTASEQRSMYALTWTPGNGALHTVLVQETTSARALEIAGAWAVPLPADTTPPAAATDVRWVRAGAAMLGIRCALLVPKRALLVVPPRLSDTSSASESVPAPLPLSTSPDSPPSLPPPSPRRMVTAMPVGTTAADGLPRDNAPTQSDWRLELCDAARSDDDELLGRLLKSCDPAVLSMALEPGGGPLGVALQHESARCVAALLAAGARPTPAEAEAAVVRSAALPPSPLLRVLLSSSHDALLQHIRPQLLSGLLAAAAAADFVPDRSALKSLLDRGADTLLRLNPSSPSFAAAAARRKEWKLIQAIIVRLPADSPPLLAVRESRAVVLAPTNETIAEEFSVLLPNTLANRQWRLASALLSAIPASLLSPPEVASWSRAFISSEAAFERELFSDEAALMCLEMVLGAVPSYRQELLQAVLRDAVHSGSARLVEWLLSHGARGAAPYLFETTELDSELRSRTAETVLRLEAPNLSTSTTLINATGWNLMHFAAACGDTKLVQVLISCGGRELLSQTDGHGSYPLSIAWQREQLDCAAVLLSHHSTEARRAAVERLLVETLLSAKESAAEWTRLLLEQAEANPNQRHTAVSEHPTLLMLACERGNLHAARKLILRGANPDLFDEKGNTCLHYAVRNSNQSAALLVVTMLIDEGRPPVNHMNIEGETSLHVALRARADQVAACLIEYGAANVNICTTVSRAPLHLALHHIASFTYDDMQVLTWPKPQLLSSLALRALAAAPQLWPMPQLQRRLAPDSLARVRRMRDNVVLMLLLQSDLSTLIQPYEGENLLFWAARHNYFEFGLYLLQRRLFSTEAVNKDGFTVLQVCAMTGRAQFGELLLQQGARRNPLLPKAQFNGVTLLQWALDHGMVGFANVLIKYGARRPPKWIPDDSVSDCSVCSREFTLFRRKHHCRNCGRVVCAECSLQRTLPMLGIEEPVLTCRTCNDDITHSNYVL